MSIDIGRHEIWVLASASSASDFESHRILEAESVRQMLLGREDPQRPLLLTTVLPFDAQRKVHLSSCPWCGAWRVVLGYLTGYMVTLSTCATQGRRPLVRTARESLTRPTLVVLGVKKGSVRAVNAWLFGASCKSRVPPSYLRMDISQAPKARLCIRPSTFCLYPKWDVCGISTLIASVCGSMPPLERSPSSGALLGGRQRLDCLMQMAGLISGADEEEPRR